MKSSSTLDKPVPDVDLESLDTESRNPRTAKLDLLSSVDLVRALHSENFEPARAVERVLPKIVIAVDAISDRLRQGGRLFYFGAGTSGRIGVLDASECPPTFGVEPDMVLGIIAGGDRALRESIEGAEDDSEAGDCAARTARVGPKDVVVGIAASGRTPFVIGALRYANTSGAYTIAVVNVSQSEMDQVAELTIAAVTGPEPITGSTRLKAGTAQKMVLNLLTTAAMIRLGKTFGNLMVDVRATNKKLRDRAIRIVMEAAVTDVSHARTALELCQWDAKTAIASICLGLTPTEARERIMQAGGFLRTVLAEE
jgi:N-acetylmuramic acid 6-phosphate etherase